MRYFLLASLFFFSSVSFADELTSEGDTKKLCESFSNKIISNLTIEAFDEIKPHWPLPKEEIDNLSYQTKSQLELVGARFGDPIKVEFVKTKYAGASFLEQIFLGKFINHAIRISCIFYKPDNAWKVNSIIWNDKVSELLE